MIKLSYEEVVKRIKSEKGVSEAEIEDRVNKKLKQLSDLISKEGAAHIVANELGVKIIETIDTKKEYKINELNVSVRGGKVLGKVIRMYEVRSFKKENREGKVGSFLIGDETGFVRVVLWDVNHIAFMEKGELKIGDIVKIEGGYIRDNNGFKELHVGNLGGLEINPPGIIINARDISERSDFNKKQLKDLKDGENNVGVLGTIVQVFEPRFFSVCPECGKKTENFEGKSRCAEHGEVVEKFASILNVFFDDGTENIRVVCFRNQVEKLLGLSEGEVLKFKENPSSFEEVRGSLLGKQVMFVGRVVKNQMFDRLELLANRVVDLKPEDLLKEMPVS